MGDCLEFQEVPGQQHTLGADWIEGNFAEKDLVDNTLSVSQWCFLVVKEINNGLSCINNNVVSKLRKVPSIQLSQDPLWSCVSNLGLSSTRQTQIC